MQPCRSCPATVMKNQIPLLIAIAFLAGCADPEKDWELAARDDSPETYLQFLAKYPNSEQADLARQRIEALKVIRAWERAEFKDSEDAYAAFVEKFPDSEFVAEAEIRIAAIERDRQWDIVAEAGTSDALSSFIAAFPAAPQRAEAEELLAEALLAEQAVIEASTPKERTGAFRLQLAAFRTPEAAESELRRLVDMFPTELLGPVRIETPADRNNDGNLFLLKTIPMTGDEAREVCELLQSRRQQCMIINR